MHPMVVKVELIKMVDLAARANERGVIDIQTLENVQKSLLDTCEEVIQIQAEGKKNREEAKKQLAQMEQDLKQRLIK